MFRPFQSDEFSSRKGTSHSTDFGYLKGNRSLDSSVPQTTRCPLCPNGIFAGSYQKINLERHLLVCHSDVQRLDCLVPGCAATFAPGREDNRLTHVKITHPTFPLPAQSAKGKVISKASDANNIRPVDSMTTISEDASMTTISDDASMTTSSDDASMTPTSDDASMKSSKTKELSSCSDVDSSSGQSEDGTLDDHWAHVDREKGHPTETIFIEYERMLASMSHHSTDDKLAVIESQSLETLFTREANQQHYASLKVDWDILAFLEDQFHDQERPHSVLGSIITITGSAQHAQATTCLDYIRQNWAAHGSQILDTIQDALLSPNQISHSTIGAYFVNDSAPSSVAEFQLRVDHEAVCLKIKSETSDIIVDTIQQLAWMGAALRNSADGQVQYCEPKLEQVSKAGRGEPTDLHITFELSSLSEEDQSCWLPLFADPVIARGFPVPERKNGERGLEIPLEIMAALGGARHVTEFEGGLVMKGFSAMFVPVERHYQSIQWHLIRRSDEQRVLYRDVSKECPSRAMLEEVDHESLENSRAFLGWWRSAETHLGTADAAYDSIDWSPASETRSSARISGANIGFQHIFTGQLSFTMGAKDGRLHFSQKGPFQKIVQCAEKTPVVLYDPADRRGWCVSGLDLMLHVIQTRHHLSPYQIDGKLVELTPAMPKNGRAAATAAIAANQQRQLYEHNVATEKVYYFKDAILDIWSQMERLMEKEDSMEACAGLALHGTMRSKIHGWELMSLVHEKNYRRKEAIVAKSSGGWVDLINDVDALVLFAAGLDEIIRPVSDLSNLCRPWRTLPKGKDFLAAGVPMMELFYSEAGSRISRKHLSTSHLQWHRGSALFEPCSDTTSIRCKCDRTQQIYHDSLLKTFGHVQPPGKLEENGCVVFGQAHNSFKPHKRIAIKQNAVHMLPNISIQISKTNRHSPTEDDALLSPPPVALVSPEPEETNVYATQNSNSPPSPLHSNDHLMHDKTITLRRKRRLSHIQLSESNSREGHDICNDEESSSDDYVVYGTAEQSLIEHDTISKRQRIASTPTGSAPKGGYEPVHVTNSIRREAKIEHYGHLCGCSCTTCLSIDCEPPGSLKVIGTITDTRRNSMKSTERKKGQPV